MTRDAAVQDKPDGGDDGCGAEAKRQKGQSSFIDTVYKLGHNWRTIIIHSKQRILAGNCCRILVTKHDAPGGNAVRPKTRQRHGKMPADKATNVERVNRRRLETKKAIAVITEVHAW